MNITKCDICKKIIKFGTYSLGCSEICLKCGSPVVEFMKDKKLIKEEKSGRK